MTDEFEIFIDILDKFLNFMITPIFRQVADDLMKIFYRTG